MNMWRKSKRCSNSQGCVEVQINRDEIGDTVSVSVRDSKDENSPVLTFTPAEWSAFVAGIHDGEFDVENSPSEVR